LNADFPEAQRRSATVAFTVGSALYTLAIGIAFINAYAVLAFHFVAAAYYAVDPISRRAANAKAPAP
jgi:hypothetical protein